MTGVTFANGLFVCANSGSTTNMSVSADGKTWVNKPFTNTGSYAWQLIFSGPGWFCLTTNSASAVLVYTLSLASFVLPAVKNLLPKSLSSPKPRAYMRTVL